MSDLTPIQMDGSAPANGFVAIEVHELRSLIRIAVELRDPRWADQEWIKKLAAKCGLTVPERA